LKRFEISGFIVESIGLPATIEDANPFECECSNGSLVGCSFFALLGIVSAGPERFVDGLAGPFNKGLAQKG
jgi:hypothetical protein